MTAIVVGLAALFMSGCATVTRGTKDTLVIESDPAGATVSLSTGQTGKTPTSFKLPRSESLVVRISKEGYESIEVNVSSQVVTAGAAGMAGNVLVGGLIGAGVDAFSGAMKDLKPNPIRVTMVKLPDPAKSVAAIAPEGGGDVTARLRDLKASLDSGLISQEEYERQRAKLLDADAAGKTEPVKAPPASAAATPAGNPGG